MKLSVLDQSPILDGRSAADAIAATLELAQAAEALGYQRYWLAEHHGLLSLAAPCAEILLARIGSLTKKNADRHRRYFAALLRAIHKWPS